MGLFERFPYTNFHELNIDWLLSEIKQLRAAWDSADFDKLIADQLQRLIDSGELADLLTGAEYKVVEIDSRARAMSTAIISGDGSFIIIDFGNDDSQAGAHAVQVIRSAGGATMAGAILTHAHHDHIGDYQTIFEAFDKSKDFAVYMPPRPSAAYASDIILRLYDEFYTYVTGQGYRVINPTGGRSYNIGGRSVRFYNTNISKYEDPEVTYNYNNTSLCGVVNLGIYNFGFFGDIYPAAQANIAAEEIGLCDIITAPHHGLGTGIDPAFLAKVHPAYILGNFGSAYNETGTEISPLAWNSAIDAYCQEFNAGFYDTLENGDMIFTISRNGKIITTAKPFIYPGEIATFASLRNATNLISTSATSSTHLRDLLLMMQPNSRVHFYATGKYYVSSDLGLPAGTDESPVYYSFDIVKFTGGSTNALYDRNNKGSFWFEIVVESLREGTIIDRQIGTYRATTNTWRLDRVQTSGLGVFDVGVDGSVAMEGASDTSLYTAEAAAVRFTRTGRYLCLCTGQLQPGDAAAAGGDIDGYKLIYGVPRVITITAGTHALTNEDLASRYVIQYLPGQGLSNTWPTDVYPNE